MAISYKDPKGKVKGPYDKTRNFRKSGKSENEERSPDDKMRGFEELVDRIAENDQNPKSQGRKVSITIRLDPEIITYFQSTGTKWQTRINEVLLAYVNEQNARETDRPV